MTSDTRQLVALREGVRQIGVFLLLRVCIPAAHQCNMRYLAVFLVGMGFAT